MNSLMTILYLDARNAELERRARTARPESDTGVRARRSRSTRRWF
jgi:hypothetical protein